MIYNIYNKIVIILIVMFLTGCSSGSMTQDNRADEQRNEADKAQRELSRETQKKY